MSTVTPLHTSAVNALTEKLPTPLPYGSIVLSDRAVLEGRTGQAMTAAFVGGLSADLALILPDTSFLAEAAGADSALVSAADVLRPSLEAAAAVLGAGVLGETRVGDAEAMFADKDAVVFQLMSAGNAAGWFAVRILDRRTVNAGPGFRAPVPSEKLSRIHNVEMALTVAIGHTRMSVRDVLDLEPGGVIELDRSAGAPADVMLNGRLIAHGEIVVVDQDYAVKITRILDVAEGVG
ncbi:MAG: flagellar motor switch protein FliN [Arthrobacter sp.]